MMMRSMPPGLGALGGDAGAGPAADDRLAGRDLRLGAARGCLRVRTWMARGRGGGLASGNDPGRRPIADLGRWVTVRDVCRSRARGEIGWPGSEACDETAGCIAGLCPGHPLSSAAEVVTARMSAAAPRAGDSRLGLRSGVLEEFLGLVGRREAAMRLRAFSRASRNAAGLPSTETMTKPQIAIEMGMVVRKFRHMASMPLVAATAGSLAARVGSARQKERAATSARQEAQPPSQEQGGQAAANRDLPEDGLHDPSPVRG